MWDQNAAYASMSNVGRWSGWATWAPTRLGGVESYQKMVEWLDGHGDIADWGGGTGFAQQFVTKSAYRVIDGSLSQSNHVLIDLTSCNIPSDCIMMRHVLEHDYKWHLILLNFMRSFRKRAVLAIGTPLESGPTVLDHTEQVFFGSVGLPVPVLRLSEPELLKYITLYQVKREHLGRTAVDVPDETIFYLEK